MNSEINTYSNSFLGNFGIPLRCALCSVHVYVVQGTNLLFYFILVTTKTNFNFN